MPSLFLFLFSASALAPVILPLLLPVNPETLLPTALPAALISLLFYLSLTPTNKKRIHPPNERTICHMDNFRYHSPKEKDDFFKANPYLITPDDVPVILHLHPKKSEYALFTEKTGILPAETTSVFPSDEELSRYIAKRFAGESRKKVRHTHRIIVNPRFPFAVAAPAFLIARENAGLSCFTALPGSSLFPDHADELVENAIAYHFMMVTGKPKWYVARLTPGTAFRYRSVKRSSEKINALAHAEESFFRALTTNQPPTPDGSLSTTNAIHARYPVASSELIDLSDNEDILSEFVAITAQMADIKRRKDEIANQIKSVMQNADRGVSQNFRVNWSSATRTSFDTKSFTSVYPTIDITPFSSNTTLRTFRVMRK